MKLSDATTHKKPVLFVNTKDVQIETIQVKKKITGFRVVLNGKESSFMVGKDGDIEAAWRKMEQVTKKLK